MFPFNFEWSWDVGHLLFFGGFWYAMSILGLGMVYCIGKAIMDTVAGKGGHH